MAIVNSRNGRRYIIDFRKTKDFIIPQPRGRSVRLGVEVFYANGIEEFRLGDIVLTTADTPMYQPKVEKNMYSLEWVDTDAEPGVKGYAFTYREAGRRRLQERRIQDRRLHPEGARGPARRGPGRRTRSPSSSSARSRCSLHDLPDLVLTSDLS